MAGCEEVRGLKPPKYPLFPINVSTEKARFFESTTYNPQFQYDVGQSAREQLLANEIHHQDDGLLAEATRILDVASAQYGTGRVLQTLESQVGTALLSLEEADIFLNQYLADTKMDSFCCVKWASLPNSATFVNCRSVSYARFKAKHAYFEEENLDASKHYLFVSKHLERTREGFARLAAHEIGTHLVRRVNEELQPWNFMRKHFCLRKPLETREDLQTEEGLATINEVLCTPDQYLTQSALNYVAVVMAKQFSFREVYNKLAQYVSCPQRRWRICLIVKRGCRDTSFPGGDGKAQTYFEGAVKILRRIDSLDIDLLYCGKVAVDQHSVIERVVRRRGLTLPGFVNQSKELYRRRLQKIAEKNQIWDTNQIYALNALHRAFELQAELQRKVREQKEREELALKKEKEERLAKRRREKYQALVRRRQAEEQRVKDLQQAENARKQIAEGNERFKKEKKQQLINSQRLKDREFLSSHEVCEKNAKDVKKHDRVIRTSALRPSRAQVLKENMVPSERCATPSQPKFCGERKTISSIRRSDSFQRVTGSAPPIRDRKIALKRSLFKQYSASSTR